MRRAHGVASRELHCAVGLLATISTLTCYSKQTKGFVEQSNKLLLLSPLAFSSTLCEAHRTEPPPKTPDKPSWLRQSLASIYLTSLPIPRTLVRRDPAFEDGTLKRGLRQRARDEQTLRGMQKQIYQSQQSRDPEKLKQIFAKVTQVAYGKGVTPQMREDFLIQYGCTGWTDEVLQQLIEIGNGRGFVEIGAGNGQWARALTDYYRKVIQDPPIAFEFVLAYDDMTELPLSPKVYHKHTQPAHDYFYSRVRECKDGVTAVFRQWSTRGRILLLVYPPPTSLALETIKSYVEMGPENDTVVYVGEGRGGSTANDQLFDYLEEQGWILLQVMKVQSQPGDKGFEKLFILRRPAMR